MAALALHRGAAQLIGEIEEGRGDHRPACRKRQAVAWFAHRSFSGAGDEVHFGHNGASQVPLFLFGTFQSQSSVARLPQRQRLVLVQTMADMPPGIETWWQVMRPSSGRLASSKGPARLS